jgi:hypothetical protein
MSRPLCLPRSFPSTSFPLFPSLSLALCLYPVLYSFLCLHLPLSLSTFFSVSLLSLRLFSPAIHTVSPLSLYLLRVSPRLTPFVSASFSFSRLSHLIFYSPLSPSSISSPNVPPLYVFLSLYLSLCLFLSVSQPEFIQLFLPFCLSALVSLSDFFSVAPPPFLSRFLCAFPSVPFNFPSVSSFCSSLLLSLRLYLLFLFLFLLCPPVRDLK